MKPGQDERVGMLLRALVSRVHELGASTGATDGLVLDLQVMGLRCVLLRAEPSADTQVGLLSPREQEVARMVSLGHTNKTIAGVLEISLYTVSTHLRRIFAKLDVSTRAAMVAVLSGNQQLLATGQATVGGADNRNVVTQSLARGTSG